MWNAFIELIRLSIFSAAHVCGGSLGSGIMCVSIVLRVALLPVTLRIARQARAQQLRIAAIKPELTLLQRRHAKDPARLMRETQSLYAANDIKTLTPGSFAGMLVQMPLLGGLFAAVRSGLGARVSFLWIPNLARPDAALLALVTLFGGAALVFPRPPIATSTSAVFTMLLLSGGFTLFFLWSASSAVALSYGAGSFVTALQNWLLSRDRIPATASA